MIREKEQYYSPIIFLLDFISVFVSFGLSVYIYMKFIIFLDPALTGFRIPLSPMLYWDATLNVLPFLTAIFILFFNIISKKEYIQRRRSFDFITQTIMPCIVSAIIFFGIAAINPQFGVNSLFLAVFIILLWFFLSVDRLLMLSIISFLHTKSGYIRYLLIIGTNKEAVKMADLFERHPKWGIRVVGFLTYDFNEVGTQIGNYSVIGTIDDMMITLEKNVVDFVLLSQLPEKVSQIYNASLRCKTVGIDFIMDSDILFQKVEKVSIEKIENSSIIFFKSVWNSPEKLFIKRAIDFFVSGILIVLFAPFWAVIPFIIKRDSPGPTYYIQERVGKNGRLFPMYKFRNMVVGAEKMQTQLMHLNEMDGPVFKIKDDPRLTRVGKLLRRTSLDELPQLFNVFLGNMSLVGPRPPILKEVLQYRPWQRKRLSVTPGVTCLWQVSGRNEIKFDEWMKLDMQYIDNWSLLLDLKILFMTVKAVISRKGAL